MAGITRAEAVAVVIGVLLVAGSVVIADLTNAGGAATVLLIMVAAVIGGLLWVRTLPMP